MAVYKRLTTNSETQEVDKIPNAIAHAVWGAIEAAVAKGNATAGAIAGASSELAAPLIAKALYGTDDPKQLTEVQKQNIVNLSSLAGAIGAGIANGNGSGTEVLTSANQGAEIGKRAVEHNAVNQEQSGTDEEFLELFNNSPSKMGRTVGKDAEDAMLRLDDIEFKLPPTPATTGYFNLRKGRYIYTEEGGWLDMTHFLFYAGVAYSEKKGYLERQDRVKSINEHNAFYLYDKISAYSPEQVANLAISKAVQKGYQQERLDGLKPSSKHSSYSYEDLPSDRYGAIFGAKYFDPKSDLTFGEQLSNYLKILKPTNPKFAPNYSELPVRDYGVHPGIENKTTKPLYTRGNK
ncbi:VENN motif pre-toxin domain-containing protein [Haemophilus haemolyticus]|uniref:VENN motif pre-toxin domain-containing protein n=2 Tax=Haemophilus haemolyticus TaxID=726 RepID=A0A852PSE6_HAEHA|nr:VENN motif pre-toxin domain-containing protein [Haemophilus haemolyticus]